MSKNKKNENKTIDAYMEENVIKHYDQNNVEDSNRKTKRRKIFWKIYATAVVVAIALIIFSWNLLWRFLVSYEKSQPENTVDQVMNFLSRDDTEELLKYIQYDTASPFENTDVIKNYMDQKLGDGNWTYAKKLDESTEEALAYKICKDNSQVAILRLQKQSESGAFRMNRWEISSLDGIFDAKQDYTVTVPSDATVTVNGIALSNDYMIEDGIVVTDLSNVSSLIKVPVLKKYRVDGLLTKPEIKATGAIYGNELKLKNNQNNNLEFQFESDDSFNQMQQDRIVEITKKYGSYVANDVQFPAISGDIMPNSYAYSFLKGLQKTNVWFASHSAIAYNDLTVDNYQMYTQDCFSCEVTFTMVVPTAMKTFEYPTHLKYTFVKVNNNWYIADFAIK